MPHFNLECFRCQFLNDEDVLKCHWISKGEQQGNTAVFQFRLLSPISNVTFTTCMELLLPRSPTLCFRYDTLSVDVRHVRGLRVLVAWARTDWSLVLGRLNTGHSGNYHRRQGSLD